MNVAKVYTNDKWVRNSSLYKIQSIDEQCIMNKT